MRNIMCLLHADGEHGTHGGLFDAMKENFGEVGVFIEEVIFHGIIETLQLSLFLFLTYLFMEFIEHKASDKLKGAMEKSGSFGPLLGGALGALPQCGFSAAASNLYTGRVITLGTLVAVFLSTSDEMLPVLIAGEVEPLSALLIIVYKVGVGVAVGFGIDLVGRLTGKAKREINIDEICDEDNCHCENGILFSALHHTLTTSLFVLIITVLLNAAMYFIGEEGIRQLMPRIPVVSHLICAIIGLIPNCAVSIALTKLALGEMISVGAMLAGLFSGTGVGLIVLFRMNKNIKENLIITATVVAVGVVFGLLADLLPFLSLA